MKQLLLILTLLVPSFAVAADPELFPDGDYTVKITQMAKHPQVQFPNGKIADKEFKDVANEKDLRLVISGNGKDVVIAPDGIQGVLAQDDGHMRTYNLTKGLFAGGRLTVEKTKKGLRATFTVFGSGVPIISSSRGLMTATK